MKGRCYICKKGNLHKKKVDYLLYGVNLGRFEAEVCNSCGEIFYAEEESRRMTEMAKKKGLWGLAAKTKIGQSGTTLDIRLPRKVIEFMHIKKGKEVMIIQGKSG